MQHHGMAAMLMDEAIRYAQEHGNDDFTGNTQRKKSGIVQKVPVQGVWNLKEEL